MRSTISLLTVIVLALSWGRSAPADTTEVRWQTKVVVAKSGDHCRDDGNCFNRYHPEIPAVLRAKDMRSDR